jgi:hypothetical protein
MAISNVDNGQSKSSVFNYFVIFILGLLIASNIFILWQYTQLQRLAEGLRTDTVNIIQAYNTLVNTLSQQGTIKGQPQAQSPAQAPAQPTSPVTEPNQ